jgi:hypothetical protein
MSCHKLSTRCYNLIMRSIHSTHIGSSKVHSWLPWVYGFGAISLVPWIVNLAYVLPARQTLQSWSLMWVGIDLFTLGLIILVVFLSLKRSAWLSLALAALAMLNITDAWFDVVTASAGHDRISAVGLALLVEFPWAILSIWAAILVQRQLIVGSDQVASRPYQTRNGQ